MRRYCTNLIEMEIDGRDDLDECMLYATVKQKTDETEVTITKSGEDLQVDGQKVTVTLTQDESARFTAGEQALLQLRGVTQDGEAWGTNICGLDVSDALYEEVIAYGGT